MIFCQKMEGRICTQIEETPVFDQDFDFVVVGLGVAGAIACIEGARRGLKTLGVEALTSMGGMGTNGAILGYYFGTEGGSYEKIDAESLTYNGSCFVFSGGSYGAESKKYVLDEAARRYNAHILYESVCIGVYREERRVTGLRLWTPEGEKNVSCRILVDGTGNADVCALAGCEIVSGRDLDGRMQPFSSVKVYREKDRIYSTNRDNGVVDPSDPYAMSRAILYSHAAWRGKDNAGMLYLASLPGIREGRRIVGEYMATLNDYFSDHFPEDVVFYANADLDKHGLDNAFENRPIQDWWVAANLGAANVSIPISYRSLIPRGFDGIFAVGRCIGQDRDLMSCVRMMRDMQKCGEVAAVAASLAISKGCATRNVPYDEIKAQLVRSGCFNERDNRGFRFENPQRTMNIPFRWMTELEEVYAGLKSNKPAVAIWSCKRLKAAIIPSLQEWMQSEEENLRRNSAVALALIGEKKALPVLREIVIQRDQLQWEDCRKNNQYRIWAAIYLIGILEDDQMISELIRLLDPKEEQRPEYHKEDFPLRKSPTGYNNHYLQVVTHALRALIRIGDAYPTHRTQIIQALFDVRSRKGFLGNYRLTESAYAFPEFLISTYIIRIIDQTIESWKKENGKMV